MSFFNKLFRFFLNDLFFWNKGEIPAKGFTIKFHFSETVYGHIFGAQQHASLKQDYQVSYSFDYSTGNINPGYKWTEPQSNYNFKFQGEANEIKCLVEVYYNNPIPALAEFTIKLTE